MQTTTQTTEPTKIFKLVTMMDSTTGIELTGQVETEASLRARLATTSASSQFEVWINARLAVVEKKLADMNWHAGQCDWMCYGEAGHDESTTHSDISYEHLSPASIHGVE